MFVQAQDNIPILDYDEQEKFVVPKDTGEVEISFEGIAGDIIVVEASISTQDVLNGLMPVVSLLNERGTTIATTESDTSLENFDPFSATLPLEIPSDSTYTILVTTSPFSVLQNDAPFTLRLLQPSILQIDDVNEGQVDSEFSAYYVVISKDVFSIQYEYLGGDFFPAVNIARIEDGILQQIGSMFGEGMKKGSLTLEPNRNTLHLVEITTAIFDNNNLFTVSSAEFSVTLRTETD